MDFKKLIADLAARYRKLTEPISSSSLAPPGQVVDVDAAHEAGRKAGYEAGYKKGYDEGLQVGLEAKTLPEPSGPKSQSQPPSESPPLSLSLYERLGGVYSIATVIDDFIDRDMIDPRLNANPKVDALSGGYTRADACKRLAANHGMIASFSRALTEDLRHSMSDAEFNATLAKSIDEIYQASTVKV
jgi:hypothetical protein